MKQLNKELIDGANDSQLGLELQQQKQRRGGKKGGREGGCMSPGPGLQRDHCSPPMYTLHYTNAVVRKQRKYMVMKQLAF